MQLAEAECALILCDLILKLLPRQGDKWQVLVSKQIPFSAGGEGATI